MQQFWNKGVGTEESEYSWYYKCFDLEDTYNNPNKLKMLILEDIRNNYIGI